MGQLDIGIGTRVDYLLWTLTKSQIFSFGSDHDDLV